MQQWVLPVAATSAGQGRQFVAGFCAGRGVPDEVVDDAVLLVSELLGNAYVHAGTAVVLTAGLHAGVLRVEVRDDSPDPPAVLRPEEEATGGRGLLIVQALAARWGVRGTAAGKVVWFELDGAGDPQPAG